MKDELKELSNNRAMHIKLATIIYNSIEKIISSVDDNIIFDDLMAAFEFIIFFYIQTCSDKHDIDDHLNALKLFHGNIQLLFLESLKNNNATIN